MRNAKQGKLFKLVLEHLYFFAEKFAIWSKGGNCNGDRRRRRSNRRRREVMNNSARRATMVFKIRIGERKERTAEVTTRLTNGRRRDNPSFHRHTP
jgi:hypothetical protein